MNAGLAIDVFKEGMRLPEFYEALDDERVASQYCLI